LLELLALLITVGGHQVLLGGGQHLAFIAGHL
jgi:hypothetical protein